MIDKFKERNCPLCSSNGFEDVVHVSMKNVFKINPTYNEAWFNEDTVSPEFDFPIVKCRTCGFVFSRFVMNDELSYQYYNEGINAEKSREKIFRKAKRTLFIELWKRLHELSDDREEMKVLDFGAGWGDFLAVAKSPGVAVFGLEFDQRKVDFARAYGVSSGDANFIREHQPYGIFMCNQVLEHLDKPLEVLRDLRGLLKLHAVGYIAVPNFDEYILQKDISFIKKGVLKNKDIDPLGHLNYFTPASLRRMVGSAGFQEIDPPVGKKNGLLTFVNKKEKERIMDTGFFVRAV